VPRSKEIARVEGAIDSLNKKELLWSLDYVRQRLRNADKRDNVKHWKEYEKKLLVILNKLSANSSRR
jgi:hypothetical protein